MCRFGPPRQNACDVTDYRNTCENESKSDRQLDVLLPQGKGHQSDAKDYVHDPDSQRDSATQRQVSEGINHSRTSRTECGMTAYPVR